MRSKWDLMRSKALQTFFRSIMYKINSNGPRIDLWGTLHIISWNGIFSLLSVTKVILKQRKIVFSYTIKLSFLKRIWWFTVSNSLLMGLQRCPKYIYFSQIGIIAWLLIRWLRVRLDENCKAQTVCSKKSCFC